MVYYRVDYGLLAYYHDVGASPFLCYHFEHGCCYLSDLGLWVRHSDYIQYGN